MDTFLERVFSQLDESDQQRLREIVMADEPPVTRAEAEQLVDQLGIRRIEQELRDVQTCLESPDYAAHRPALLIYRRGLTKLLAAGARESRRQFLAYLGKRRGQG